MPSSISRSKMLLISAAAFFTVVILAYIQTRHLARVLSAGPVPADGSAGTSGAVKLSVIDNGVDSPSVLATADGTVHVIFAEQQTASPYTPFLYYRSSRDGGKSWTAPKNLSEILPNTPVGNTRLLSDSSGRVYAIWRTSYLLAGQISQPSSQRDDYNLVYRVLAGGGWSNAVYIHPPTSMAHQGFGSASWFAANDPSTGKVDVFWNTSPAPRHPESYLYGMVGYGIKLGSVMRSVLDGATASQPEEVFHTPIAKRGNDLSFSCDGLDVMNGYVDSSGQPHILAQVASPGATEQNAKFQLIENNTQYAAIELPGRDFRYWLYPPTLLVDAQGRRHVIATYPYGDAQSVRDYALGSNAEPQTVRAARAGTGKVIGVEAFQGPGGRMAALIQMADTNELNDAEGYLVTNDGNRWNTPVNLTNNAGRTTFHNAQTGAHSNVATMSSWFPGIGAAAYDAAGHLYVAYIVNRKDLFEENAHGVSLAGGSSAVPQLLFARF